MESKDKSEKDSIMITKEFETCVLMVDDFGCWESMNTFFLNI
jgi:hypothetical protein